jgi:DNA-binding transcriptional LysR family regulator
MSETINRLGLLLLFRTVAELCSFRKAADIARVSPATVSRRIAELERRMDVQLFVRTTRQVLLTDAGTRLFNDTKGPVQQLEDATNRVSNMRDTMNGEVRIATTFTIAETVLLPLIPSIYQQESGIRINLVLDEDVIDIRGQNIDFALRIGKIADPTLIARKIGTERLGYFSAPQAGPSPPLLSYGDREFEPEAPQLRAKDMRLLAKLVKGGFGGAWLPDSLCVDAESAGILTRDTTRPAAEFELFLVYHANRFIPRRVQFVMDMVTGCKPA